MIGQLAPRSVPAWYDGLRVTRAEVRTVGRLVAILAAAGIPTGLLWLLLAPRRQFEVVADGFRTLEPQSEALIGADSWLMIITGSLGVLAGLLVWRLVRARGVGVLTGLTVGMVLLAVVAWQVGELLGTGSSAAEQAQLGAIVTPPLHLRAIPALVMGAFLATLTYLVLVTFARRDDLQPGTAGSVSSGMTEPQVEPVEPVLREARPAPSIPDAGYAPGPPAEPRSDPRPAMPGDPRQ